LTSNILRKKYHCKRLSEVEDNVEDMEEEDDSNDPDKDDKVMQ
jgi:hypothetical protein